MFGEMQKVFDYVQQNSSSRLIKTAVEIALKNPSMQEEMLLYIIKYMIEENEEMAQTIRKLMNDKLS